MSLLVQFIKRWTYFLATNCPGFDTTTVTFCAALLDALPYFMYFGVGLIVAFKRTLWWFWMGALMLYNSLIIFLIGRSMSFMNNGPSQCGALEYDSPPETVALMFFYLGYFMVASGVDYDRQSLQCSPNMASELPSHSHTSAFTLPERLEQLQWHLMTRTLFLLALAILVAVSEVYLHVYDAKSVSIGGAIGLIDGLLMARLYYWLIEPNQRNVLMQVIVYICCLEKSVISTNSLTK